MSRKVVTVSDGGGPAEISGLDALDLPVASDASRAMRVWRATWPKLFAVAVSIAGWQALVWSQWRPDYVLPGPRSVFARLAHDFSRGELPHAIGITLQRAITGYAVAIVLGLAVGVGVVRTRALRAAAGSLITGLQTMPSIAWFPLAILLFQLSEAAIVFVVVIGAAPAIANGVIAGIDQIPPILLRAGRVLGARGARSYRHVVLPAAMPGIVAGLKQGWAFAWRSLMAGELLVIIAAKPSIGVQLQLARENADAEGLLAAMIVILLIGIVVDSALFGALDRSIRRRRGLLDPSTTP